MQQAAHLIGRQITAGLKGDRAKQAAVAAEKIEGHLAAGKPKEVWWSLNGWYKAATNHAPKTSKMALATQTSEHVSLYRIVASNGDPIPFHVNKADIPDNIPSDGDCGKL